MSMQVRRPVLLTGAGFTHNFGGFLAEDMWTQIFNHPKVQRNPILRAEMQKRSDFAFDFEGLYERVVLNPNREFSNEVKAACCDAIKSVYGDLDLIVRKSQAGQEIVEFAERFAGSDGGPGYFFTINQDLFVERRMHFRKILDLPGLEKGQRFSIRFSRAIDRIQITLPNEDTVQQIKKQHAAKRVDLFYVKLHGSSEWESSDGSFRPVIGRNKKAVIDREPLLRWYHELFRQVLTVPGNRRLVVVGYSFRDPHINSAIAEACNHRGLRVYVIDPARLQELQSQLCGRPGESIWTKGLAGYYRWPLRSVLVGSGRTEAARIALKGLQDAVFGV